MTTRQEFSALIPVDEAVEQLLADARLLAEPEMIRLETARDRVLAEPLIAPCDVPGWDNSAMDGYALQSAYTAVDPVWLQLSGKAAAGYQPEPLQNGHVMRILTGAPLPEGADAVVPQEDCSVEEGRVQVPLVRAGQHVRRRAEEWSKGETVLQAGVRLAPQHLGLLASLGVDQVPVYRPLRVGLVCSGDELCEPGQPLGPGQLYNSNRYSVASTLSAWGFDVHVLPTLPDQLEATCTALQNAAQECDVLISTGGVSVGDEDHLKEAVRRVGQLNLWRLAIQPGKPFAYGYVEKCPWLGLPGNPAAAWITLLVVARPYLLRVQGIEQVLPLTLTLQAGFCWDKPSVRRQYLRACIEQGNRVQLHPQQSSAMLKAAAWAQGLVIIERQETVEPGQPVRFLPFGGLLD